MLSPNQQLRWCESPEASVEGSNRDATQNFPAFRPRDGIMQDYHESKPVACTIGFHISGKPDLKKCYENNSPTPVSPLTEGIRRRQFCKPQLAPVRIHKRCRSECSAESALSSGREGSASSEYSTSGIPIPNTGR